MHADCPQLRDAFLFSGQFRLVVKTALKLLLVFVEYSESNAPLLIQTVSAVDTKRGKWSANTIPSRWTCLLGAGSPLQATYFLEL